MEIDREPLRQKLLNLTSQELRTRAQSNANMEDFFSKNEVWTKAALLNALLECEAAQLSAKTEREQNQRPSMETRSESEDEDEDKDVDEVECDEGSACFDLKGLLKQWVWTSYLFVIGLTVLNRLSLLEDAPAKPASESCLIVLLIVFITYVCIYNALEQTRTRVYLVQVIISTVWTVFLYMMLTTSKSCPSIGKSLESGLEYVHLMDTIRSFLEILQTKYLAISAP